MKVLIGKTDCKPAETGFDASRLDVLNSHFERLINEKIIHGAEYCILHKNKVIANNSIGFADGINHKSKMKPDSVFGIASITKTFTAVAIMQLIENGLLRLDVPVGDIIPAFAKKPFDAISLYHLLTHTSGLYPDGGCFPDEFPECAWEYVDKAAKNCKDIDWVAEGISPGLRRQPGTEWAYCSFGFAILGDIITRVSGEFANDYIENHIIKPLGMTDTMFRLSTDTAKRFFINNKECADFIKSLIETGEYKDEDTGTIWENVPATAGGLCSTTSDLARFGNAMLNGGTLDGARILGRKAVEKMTAIQFNGVPDYCWGAKEPNRLYGLGFDMRQGLAYSYSKGTFMHEGAGACSIDIDPAEQLCAAWFVPFDKPKNGWDAAALYNVQNIIWSGLI